jgi:polar amino acid transport system substrate-binding protein
VRACSHHRQKGAGARRTNDMDSTRRHLLRSAAFAPLAFAILPAFARAASLDEITKRGYMTVATEDDYQPFEFFDNGKLTGYDVELMQAMEKGLPFKIKQDVIPWTGILPGVSTGKYDVAITAILVTAERMKTLDFTMPVAQSVDYYLKRKGDTNIKDIKDLSGRKLGVEAGSAMLKLLPQLDEMLKATGGKLGEVVEYQGYPEAYQDLALGRVDYVVNTQLSLASIAKAKPDVFEVGQPVAKPVYIAWAVQKGNAGLLKVLNDFLASSRKDGSTYALQKKWFGATFEDMPPEPVANS